jgi:type II secretory pathway component PulJ
MPVNANRLWHRQRGLSMVELMVGVAVGLFVVAGATMVVSNQLGDNRRLMLETQIQQDLRAAADVIAKDLRRSGHWDDAKTSVWHAGATTVASNVNTGLTHADPDTAQPLVANVPASGVQFRYTRDGAIEQSGFRLRNGAIQMLVGGNWQALTDATTLRITKFEVELNSRAIPLACFSPCGAAPACPPTQTVRDITVVIEGAAVHDATVRRGAQSNARLRNDVVDGACPT